MTRRAIVVVLLIAISALLVYGAWHRTDHVLATEGQRSSSARVHEAGSSGGDGAGGSGSGLGSGSGRARGGRAAETVQSSGSEATGGSEDLGETEDLGEAEDLDGTEGTGSAAFGDVSAGS